MIYCYQIYYLGAYRIVTLSSESLKIWLPGSDIFVQSRKWKNKKKRLTKLPSFILGYKHVANALLQQSLLEQCQSRYNSIKNSRLSYNTLVSINPDPTLSAFSSICLQINLELQVPQLYHGQYQSEYNSISILYDLRYNSCWLSRLLNLYSSGIYVSRYSSVPLVNTRFIELFCSVIQYQYRNSSVFSGIYASR